MQLGCVPSFVVMAGLVQHKAGHDVPGLQKVKHCNRILFPGLPCDRLGQDANRE
jgi:hypothetical protein